MGRNDVTVPMDDELNSAIESQLDYGDYKAAWIRQACVEKLEREGVDLDRDTETDGGRVSLQ